LNTSQIGPLDYSFGIEWLVQEAAAVVLRQGVWTAWFVEKKKFEHHVMKYLWFYPISLASWGHAVKYNIELTYYYS
jgi:hypothetical protein